MARNEATWPNLKFGAAETSHHLSLCLGLDAFGNNIHAERSPKGHDRMDDGLGTIEARQPPNKRPVDLDLIEAEIAKIRQA